MWNCSLCESEVDDDFEVCWSCGATIEGVEDPGFLTADEAGPITDPVLDGDRYPELQSLDDFAGVPIPELVACFEASNTIEAKFIVDRLIEDGIAAVADTHDVNLGVGGFQPSMWGYGPKVRVLPKDFPQARVWIANYKKRLADRDARRSVDDEDAD